MIVLGLDVGYSNLKVAVGEAGAAPTVLLRPAGAAPAAHLGERVAAGRVAQDAVLVAIDGEPWAAATEPARFEGWARPLHADYSATPAYLALVRAALALASHPRIDRLVTRLPVSQAQDPQRREALRRLLLGQHLTERGRITVADARVVPQPVGAFIDLVCAERTPEMLSRIEEGTVLVLDAGFYSFDWALIVAGELRRGASGTSLEAMSVVLEQAAARIAERHGGRPQPLALEAALRQGRAQIRVLGAEIPLGPLLAEVAREVGAVALEALRQALRREVSNVDLVVLAGGGGSLYGEQAAALFPGAAVRLAPDPVAANARGFFHYGAR
jgi:plasmid segregation protein ParM